MKRLTPLLLILGLAVSQARAQAPTQTPAGRLLIQFQQAFAPNAFIDQWLLRQNSWTTAAAKVQNGSSLAMNALMLSQSIKPERFTSTFNRTKFTKEANNAKTYTDAYNVLRSLEESFKPGTLVGRWRNQRGNWLHDLSLLR